jgi:hypothetical protein
MAGRLGERDALTRLVGRVATGGFTAVEVTGEPGIGKSVLLAELARTSRERGYRVVTHTGPGCLVDKLREALGTEPCPAGAENRRACRKEVRGLLARLAPPGVVLLLDDLHTAGGATLALLADLLDQPPRAPVLLALGYRPRQAGVRLRTLLSDNRAVERLRLGPLSESDAAALLAATVPAERIRAVHRAAGGNPLYLLALAGADLCELADRTDPRLALPPAVEARLLAEFDALPPAAHAPVRAAAVAGTEFTAELVADIAEVSDAVATAALDEAVRVDLLRPTPVDGRFAFRHPVVRCAVYAGTGPGWRHAAHRRAVAALAAAPPIARAEHLACVARPGDLVALDTLTDAARDAQRHNPVRAARLLRAALRVLPDHGPDAARRWRLRVGLARALASAGRFQDSREVLHQALRAAPDQASEARTEAVALCARVERRRSPTSRGCNQDNPRTQPPPEHRRSPCLPDLRNVSMVATTARHVDTRRPRATRRASPSLPGALRSRHQLTKGTSTMDG